MINKMIPSIVAYDVMSRALRNVAEEHIQGLSSTEVRRIDNEINGTYYLLPN